MKKKTTTLNDLMIFLQEQGVVKDDLKNFVTKDDLKSLESKMDQRFGDVERELESITNQLGEIKAELAKLEKRTRQDVDVASKDVIKLQRQVVLLEQRIRRLEKTRA
ncbi:MAG: hypothetical protein HY983_01870 [Candidatus Magasanikbacteria bacterium]|nr:hypothetical protein [Candidatus Magasanikbacteria bacterium]